MDGFLWKQLSTKHALHNNSVLKNALLLTFNALADITASINIRRTRWDKRDNFASSLKSLPVNRTKSVTADMPVTSLNRTGLSRSLAKHYSTRVSRSRFLPPAVMKRAIAFCHMVLRASVYFALTPPLVFR